MKHKIFSPSSSGRFRRRTAGADVVMRGDTRRVTVRVRQRLRSVKRLVVHAVVGCLGRDGERGRRTGHGVSVVRGFGPTARVDVLWERFLQI